MTLLFRTLGVLALFIGTSTWANTVVTIPRPYTTYLVDGKSYKASNTDIKLSAGEHQLVIRFEGNFSKRESIDMVSGEPLVVNFTTDGKEILTFDLPVMRDSHMAKSFLKQQKLNLINKETKIVKNAFIFQLPKKEGLQIGRDYQEELLALGKAFQQPIKNNDTAILTDGKIQSSGTENMVVGDKNLQSLEMLKYWYNRADPQARKAFQHWVITQQ